MKNCSLQNKRVERILLIRLRNIGDVLLMVPTIRVFRDAFPRAHIAALVNAGTEEMLTGNPLLDEVLLFDPRWKALPLGQRAATEMKFLLEVRRRKFDLAINMTEGDRGSFLCLASGAELKVGVYHQGPGFWWKKRIFHVTHEAAQYASNCRCDGHRVVLLSLHQGNCLTSLYKVAYLAHTIEFPRAWRPQKAFNSVAANRPGHARVWLSASF